MIHPLLRLSRLIHIPRFAPLIILSLLSGFVMSCSLQRQGDNLQLPPVAMVQDIRVTEGTEKTIVEIEGEEPMIYTTFRLSDPDRLVIDMAEVSLSRFTNEIQMANGPIRAIRPESSGGSNVSRLEFELSGVVETDVRTEGLNLVVEVTQVTAAPKGFRFFEDEEPPIMPPVAPDVKEKMIVEASPPVESSSVFVPDLPDVSDPARLPDIAVEVTETDIIEDTEVSAGNPSQLEKMAESPQAESPEDKASFSAALPSISVIKEKEAPLPVAKKISGIRFEPGEKLKLIVSSDGVLSPRTFFIGFGEKRRLVIDFPGVKMLSKQSRFAVDDYRVKQVRVGRHKNKLRLVLDLLSPISYNFTQNRGDLEILIEGPSTKDHSDAEGEIAPTEMVQVNEAEPDLLPEMSEMQKSEAAPDSLDVAKLENLEAEGNLSGGPDITMKSMPFPITLPSPSIAAAATLPPPLPVPDADPESAVLDEVTPPEPAPQIETEETPVQVEAVSEVSPMKETQTPLQTEVAPEEETLNKVADSPEENAVASSPEPVLEKMDEGRSPSEKVTPVSDLPPPPIPVKAEITLSPPDPPAVLPLIETAEEEVAPKEEAVEVSEPETTKLVQEKAAKKKVILRRKRREDAAARREAIALANAAEVVEAEVSNPEKYTGRKISLDFQDAEITNVVRLIADVSGLNFVMGNDVKGKITVKLNNVPWDQALEIILEVRNLGMERQGDIIRIATLANLTKQRNEKAEARETKIRAEDLLTRVIYINYAKAEKMKALLSKLLSPRGEIVVADRVNALVVKDIAGSLDHVEQMATKLDTKTPQVLIEARIVEVQPTFKRSLGVEWGADFKTNNGGNSIGIGNFSGTGTSVFNPVPDFAVNLPAATPLGGVGFSFGRFTESPFQLDLRISAGESQEMTRIVSTPKIMVLDNNEALIKQGAKIPFQTSSPNGGTNTRLVDANLELKVTPHISPDGGILLELNLTKNQPGPPIQGATQPSIFQKEVKTQILLMDGETMVIGGIYETQKSESESGIPFLKDIPGLGWLFKNKEKNETTTELLIFITPTVMK